LRLIVRFKVNLMMRLFGSCGGRQALFAGESPAEVRMKQRGAGKLLGVVRVLPDPVKQQFDLVFRAFVIQMS
jgi:hypothetical protein